MQIEQIARVAYEVIRAYSLAINDTRLLPWDEIEPCWKAEITACAQYPIRNSTTMPEQYHESWIKEMQEIDWKYGPTFDPITKEHPYLVPYAELPIELKTLDYLFVTVVRELAALPE